jgi:hypothetical protein
LLPAIKAALEPVLEVPLDQVRVHTDPKASEAAKGLSARAFAYGPHIFLGSGQSPSNLELMAHEVAHVLQQQGAPAVQRSAPGESNAYEREAQQASASAVRGERFTVRERTTPRVQRFGLSSILNFFADKANLIPGFRMFTIILGVNPVNMSPVERSAANIMRAVVEFIPGGGLITQALDNYGVFEKVGSWVEEQIRGLGMVGSSFKQAIGKFIDSLSLSDALHPGDVWERAKRIFTEPIDRLINFAKGLITGILKFIKDAILMPLAKLAEGTRGWDLLIAVLGKNPITGEAVPRTAETLIGGFMKLIGEEEVWENIKKANALARAWAWFQSAIDGLLGFVREIPSLFIQALKSLEIADIVLLPRAFIKVGSVFGGFIVRFLTWAGDSVWNLLQIIFEVVAPGAMPYLKKVGAAFKKILKNPIAFVGNLVKAGKQGFQQFADRIGAHLKAAFLDWLTGSLEGVYIPKSFDFREIVKFVLSVLGLTWQNIRQKLVKVLGEPVVKGLETTFDIVVALVRDGPAAAWEKIKEQLTNLKDMVVQGVMDFIIETVVKKAVAKIISFLIPGAAFIQAIITIYDTIMVFIDKLKKIIQVVTAFLDSIMDIANGVIGAAANKVETTLAGLLTLAISFLAGFAGLGKIAAKVMDIINKKVREPISKALDKAIDWIVATAKKLFAKLFGKKDGKPDQRSDADKNRDLLAAVAKAEQLANTSNHDRKVVEKQLPGIKREFKLTTIALITDDAGKISVRAEINPFLARPLDVADEPDLRKLLIATGFFGSAPADIDKIIKGVKSDGNGNAVFQFIRSGKYKSVPGYEQVLRQLKNPSMVHSVYMTLDQADKVPTAFVARLRFEQTPPAGGDVDLLVVSPTGAWILAYQFKGVTGLGNIKSEADKAASQLTNVPSSAQRIISIEVRNGTSSAFDLIPGPGLSGYMGGISAFKAANPNIKLKIRFSDGVSRTY